MKIRNGYGPVNSFTRRNRLLSVLIGGRRQQGIPASLCKMWSESAPNVTDSEVEAIGDAMYEAMHCGDLFFSHQADPQT